MEGKGRFGRERDLLRARKRSSERIATALTRRMETVRIGQTVGMDLGLGRGGLTLEETAEGEEEGCHCGRSEVELGFWLSYRSGPVL